MPPADAMLAASENNGAMAPEGRGETADALCVRQIVPHVRDTAARGPAGSV
jgi:hypothetical protein